MSEEWKSRAKKPADFCWGMCVGTSRGVPEVWTHNAYVSFLPHDVITGGSPHTGSQHQSNSEEPVFPALPRLSRWGSTHTTVARGKALWESLVGKPPGKATDPLIHTTGSVTLLLQLGRKAHVRALTWEEDWLSRWDSRRTPISMSALLRKPQVLAPTPHKVLGPGIYRWGIPRGPLATHMGTGLS